MGLLVIVFALSYVIGWVVWLLARERREQQKREQLNRVMQACAPRAAGFNSRRVS